MKIRWPIYSDKGRKLKDGSINGILFSKIWKQCLKEAEKYMKIKFPNIVKE